MPSTPESEETRVTDAEVEAAAEAIAALVYPAWQAMTPQQRIESAVYGFYPDEAGWARAALEAAAALHPPREGAEGEIEKLRARHKKDPRRTRHGETWCDWCKTEWPCEARQVLDALDAEQAAIAHHNETVAWRELA